MKQIQHPQYGQCYELTEPSDIAFSGMAQAALVNATVLPSGTKTPSENLWIREKYLVTREHAPEGAPNA
jgi:hypothetical protein